MLQSTLSMNVGLRESRNMLDAMRGPFAMSTIEEILSAWGELSSLCSGQEIRWLSSWHRDWKAGQISLNLAEFEQASLWEVGIR